MWAYDAELRSAKERFSNKNRISVHESAELELTVVTLKTLNDNRLALETLWQNENIITAAEVVAEKHRYMYRVKILICCREVKTAK